MRRFFQNPMAIVIFTLPALLVFSLMVYYPFVQIFYRSFFEWDGLTVSQFIGFDNYRRLMEDDLFGTSIRNGLIFAFVLMFVQIGGASFLTFAMTSIRMRGMRFLRSVYFLPVVLSITVVSQLWNSILDPDHGMFNSFMASLGFSFRQSWLSDTNSAIYVVALSNAWQYMGYQFALLYAGIKAIPEHFFEASLIDGCNKRQIYFRITMPLLAETYKLCLVMSVTGGLNAFANMMLMTGGGPGTSTYTLTFMMYRAAFRLNEFGYGCAVAVILVIQCLAAIAIINRVVAREQLTY
ncbi:sugar ABC transporter permease [Paenibacillus sp. LHD-117]|uniref:carbohydrate ABC transporter permease n=1 Tax=Paenibacillus sp. LHD-117 TaxID=3071412 RepID=UPI0027DFBEF9|nr:sugar ABC transporter permease [Paenibacillus sp. LHD-117]MDQ6420501.1 sugar ABC transporter permease [Paenibacillus sp. LHD-117]